MPDLTPAPELTAEQLMKVIDYGFDVPPSADDDEAVA